MSIKGIWRFFIKGTGKDAGISRIYKMIDSELESLLNSEHTLTEETLKHLETGRVMIYDLKEENTIVFLAGDDFIISDAYHLMVKAREIFLPEDLNA